MNYFSYLTKPIITNNPITVQILGLCSALAITQSLLPALIMSLAVIVVLGFSGFVLSLLRQLIPNSIRLILEMTIIASAVIVTDEIIKTFAPDISRILTVFVGLIVTNCIVLGQAETFARTHSPGLSLLDGLGNGIGYSFILILVATVREIIGQGTVLNKIILPTLSEGGWYLENKFMALPASAFFIIGLIIWAIQSYSLNSNKQSNSNKQRESNQQGVSN